MFTFPLCAAVLLAQFFFRYSYGAGPEWISPIGPLRLSPGVPIARHANGHYQVSSFRVVAA
ncbi:BamA/TamA family outer membrane protein [Paraburkholderia phymatum]|nr:BamA/TamA family outer membrane protein [Paraburkholderia phymatum]